MPRPRRPGLVDAVLRCYSRQWRRRHGDEAAEVALLLMRDGVPARSIAWSYLKGAARERLTLGPGRRSLGPGRRFAAGAAALLAAGSLGGALALLSASVPASAASSAQVRHARRDDAAVRLVSLLPCGGLRGDTVKQALPALDDLHVKITWEVTAGGTTGDALPSLSSYVAGGRVLSPGSISIRVTAARPAGHSADGRGGPC